MRQAVPVLVAAVALAVAAVIGFQVFSLAGRLDTIDQRIAALDQALGSANAGLAQLDGRLGTLGADTGAFGPRIEELEGQLGEMDERLDEVADVAEEARRATELFWPPWFASPPPAPEPITGTLREPFDVTVDPQLMPMTSGRYTVLEAERLENDVEVLIRWEATVGPLSVSTFSWRGYDDGGNQYEGLGYTVDEPDPGFPFEGTLAQGRQREASVYLLGAAGANQLWIELIDFIGSNALAQGQLW